MSLPANIEGNNSINEAYYIIQGSPQKNPKLIEDLLSNPVGQLEVDPLLQFDLKFDSLKIFLQSIATVVNQHANLLNAIQIELKNKIGHQQMNDSFEKISQSIVFYDQDLMTLMNNKNEKAKSENNRSLDDITNRLCKKLSSYGQVITNLHQYNKNNELNKNKNDNQNTQKIAGEEILTKVKKSKTKIKTKLDDLQKTFESRIIEVERKLISKIDGFEFKVDEIEKETLWRIKDCEELLKFRVNHEFVRDSLKELEEKLHAYVAKIIEGNNEHIDKISKDLILKLKNFDNTLAEKVNAQKKYLRDLESELSKKVHTEKYDDYKKIINDKVDDCILKIKDMMKKYDPSLDQLTLNYKSVNERANKFETQLVQFISKTELLNSKNAALKLSESDITKFTEYETHITKLNEDLKQLRDATIILQNDLTKKSDINSVNSILVKKIDRDEALTLFSQGGFDDEKARKLYKDIEDLYKRVDLVQDICDKKIKQMRKETDFTVLLKQIKGKAEDEEVQKGFANVDNKLGAVSELIAVLRKETESFSNAIKTMKSQMMRSNDGALVKTKQVIPQTCLSCGRGDSNFMPPIQNVKGNDGKNYRAPTSKLNSSLIDYQEEYDVGIDLYNDPKYIANVYRDEGRNSSITAETLYHKISKSGFKDRTASPPKATAPDKSINILGTTAYLQSITPPTKKSFRPSSAKK